MTSNNTYWDKTMDTPDNSEKGSHHEMNVNTTFEAKNERKTDCMNAVESSHSSKETGDSNTGNNEQYKPMPVKKKHRRGSRRSKKKYKPYSKLTWEEKKAVEERDSRRAVSIREKYMHEKGRPLAPFNTSQFLMAEHDTQEPDLHVHRPARPSSSADDSDEGDSASLSDDDRDEEDVRNFFQKDFVEMYDRVHSETLRCMNKEELINEYIQLENKVESLERELTSIKSNAQVNGYSTPGKDNLNFATVDIHHSSRQALEHEIERLREENQRLAAENNSLRPLPLN